MGLKALLWPKRHKVLQKSPLFCCLSMCRARGLSHVVIRFLIFLCTSDYSIGTSFSVQTLTKPTYVLLSRYMWSVSWSCDLVVPIVYVEWGIGDAVGLTCLKLIYWSNVFGISQIIKPSYVSQLCRKEPTYIP